MKKKLKAATLMESLIAMVILVVCFGIATMIYFNILHSDKQRIKLKALLLINKKIFIIKKEKKIIDTEYKEGPFILKANFEKLEGASNLFHFKLSASDGEGNMIAIHDELLPIQE